MKYDLSNDPRQVPNQYKTCSTNRKWSNEVIKVDPNDSGRPGGGHWKGRNRQNMPKKAAVGPNLPDGRALTTPKHCSNTI